MKECIILAGGLGTRLQTVVNDRPKCMAEIAGKPFLKYLFDYLNKEGFTHIVLALGFKADFVIDWLNNNEWAFSISYVIEEEPLGTGGAIKYASSKIVNSDFFVFNGDTFFKVDTDRLCDYHANNQSEITLALKPMSDFDRYGSVEINNDGRIVRFNEKQYQSHGLINGGVYLINKKVFDDWVMPSKFSFEKDILEAKLNEVNIYGCVQDNYFIDIGIPSDYEKANTDFIDF